MPRAQVRIRTALDLPDDRLAHAVLSRCRQRIRSFVLCYPNNPAGSSLSAEQAAELALYLNAKLEDARAQGDDGFSVVLDEVYLGITSAKHDPRSSILFHAPPLLLESIFLVLSASKGGWLLLYREWHVVAGGMRLTLMCVAGLGAMPGARAGVLLSPNASLIESVIKLQTACSANASIISQRGLKASLEYLMSEPQALLDVARYMPPHALEALLDAVANTAASSHYNQRVARVTEGLNQIGARFLNNAIIASAPQATFYVMADFSALPESVAKTDIELQELFRDMYKRGTFHCVNVSLAHICARMQEPERSSVNVLSRWQDHERSESLSFQAQRSAWSPQPRCCDSAVPSILMPSKWHSK